MKKNLLKKVASIALVSSMVMAPLNVFATTIPAQTGKDSANLTSVTVKGDNAAVNPIYKITLPSTLAFTLDAFEIGEKGQIYSNDYAIVNRSNVAVAVKASVKATAGSSVTLEAYDKDNAPTGTDKTAQLTMVLGKDSTGSTIDATKTMPKWAPNEATTAVRDLKDSATAPVNTWFLLDAAEYTGTTLKALAASEAGYGGFYFDGALTTHPQDANGVEIGWAAKDLNIETVYSFVSYTATEFEDLDKNTGALADTKNAFSAAPDRKSVV